MLACNHDSPSFGSPMCEHLRVLQDRALPYVNWYIGAGLNAELLCFACAGRREQGASVDVAPVCKECFEEIITEHGGPERSGGNPEIRVRPEPFNTTLKTTSLPARSHFTLTVVSITNTQYRYHSRSLNRAHTLSRFIGLPGTVLISRTPPMVVFSVIVNHMLSTISTAPCTSIHRVPAFSMMGGYGLRWECRKPGVSIDGSRRTFGNRKMDHRRKIYAPGTTTGIVP